MICKIYITEGDGQVLAGTLFLEGSQIKAEATHGYENLMQSLKEVSCISRDGRNVKVEAEPELWFRLLPQTLSGTYVRAEISDPLAVSGLMNTLPAKRKGIKDRDESYVIDICDRVLGLKAKRQHHFDFLRGTSGRQLPVDAYYEISASQRLVIEYREMQHSEPVPFFDKRMTCSGCSRAEQRRQYDELRRKILPQHGIRLIELDYSLFEHSGRKRLKRDATKDGAVIREKLSELLP